MNILSLFSVSLGGLLNALYNGLSYSLILILASAGLSLVFGLMGVVNFAHGALYAIGAYSGFLTFGLTQSFFLAILGAVVGGVLAGVVLEISVIRPLYDREPVYQLPATFGAAIVIVEGIKWVIGPDSKPFAIPHVFSGTIPVGAQAFGLYRFFLIVAGAILIILLWLFLEKTKYGLIIRAAIFDTAMVESMGYNVSQIYTVIFALGAAYAAIAGVLISPLFGVYPDMGTEIVITAFIVVVVGGLGSFRGVVVGGLLVGFAQSLGRFYIPRLALAIPFLLMIAIILVRPAGIYGVKGVFD